MPGARVRIVVLRKWFPPHDPLAAKIARLCILREDLLVEMHGVYTEHISALDRLSALSRRMYFLRNLMRTQLELSSAVNALLSDAEFKALLDRQLPSVRTRFSRMASLLNKVHPVLKDVRNDIGGHVLASAVQAALERMTYDSFGFLDIGTVAKSTHYAFVGEIVAEMLLKDVSPEERQNITSSKFASIAEVVSAFELIEYCFAIYAKDRNLLPLLDLK